MHRPSGSAAPPGGHPACRAAPRWVEGTVHQGLAMPAIVCNRNAFAALRKRYTRRPAAWGFAVDTG
jgi:hypothetical protein